MSLLDRPGLLRSDKGAYHGGTNKELCPSLVGLAYYGVTKGPTTEGLTPPEAYYGGTQSEGPSMEGNIQRGLLRRDTFRGDYHGGTH